MLKRNQNSKALTYVNLHDALLFHPVLLFHHVTSGKRIGRDGVSTRHGETSRAAEKRDVSMEKRALVYIWAAIGATVVCIVAVDRVYSPFVNYCTCTCRKTALPLTALCRCASFFAVHCRWFHGQIRRAESERLLTSQSNGTFLIRDSNTYPGDYTLSLRYVTFLHDIRRAPYLFYKLLEASSKKSSTSISLATPLEK